MRCLYHGAAMIFLAVADRSLAQGIPDPAPLANPPPQSATGIRPALTEFFLSKTPYEFWLTCVILLSGLAFSFFAFRFIQRARDDQFDSATRAVTILFVVLGTMVLISAGYNNEQIAPAFGLFGSIIGYILGRSDRSEAARRQARLHDTDEPAPAPGQAGNP